jgi:hypothetical protein
VTDRTFTCKRVQTRKRSVTSFPNVPVYPGALCPLQSLGPALSELVLALHANGVKVVLIEALHRSARDLMIQESIIADFQRSGFEVISVTEPEM